MTTINHIKHRRTEKINDFMFSKLFYSKLKDNYYMHNYNKDFQLIIVDKNNNKILSEVYSSLCKFFTIINSMSITWNSDQYKKNSLRLFNGDFITQEFLLIIVEDKSPRYHLSVSDKLYKNINISFFKCENNYLNISYITDEISGFFRLATLLFGKNELIKILNGKNINTVNTDPVGTTGWMDFKEFIDVANTTLDWLVLRNFEYLPYDFFENDKDVDMLCSDVDLFTKTMNLTKRSWGVGSYQTVIEGKNIPFDVRFLGDNYYDKLWEHNMLKTMILTKDNVPRMNDVNYFFSLLYHAKIQKNSVKSIYIDRLFKLSKKIGFTEYEKYSIYQDKEAAEVISNFLSLHKYKYTNPLDISVIENKLVLNYLDGELKNEISIKIPLIVKVKRYIPDFLFKLIPTKVKNILKWSFPYVFKS